jgi:hypothetical protein
MIPLPPLPTTLSPFLFGVVRVIAFSSLIAKTNNSTPIYSFQLANIPDCGFVRLERGVVSSKMQVIAYFSCFKQHVGMQCFKNGWNLGLLEFFLFV